MANMDVAAFVFPLFVLLLNASDLSQFTYSIGEFQIDITNNSEKFELYVYYPEPSQLFPVHSITHKYNDASLLPFIQIAFASLQQEPITAGNFQNFLTDQQYHYSSSDVTIESISQNALNQHIIISGHLTFNNLFKPIQYSFTLRPPSTNYPYYEHPNKGMHSNKSIDFNISLLTNQSIPINRIWLRYNTNASESFMGFGQQYSFANFRNKIVPIVISEQGVGRGVEPVTSYLNKASNGAGGSWHTSYGSKPLYLTNYKRSFLLYNYEIIVFNLTHEDYVQVEVYINDTNMVSGRMIYGETPNDLISQITLVCGRQKPLPLWILQGGILGIEGGQQAVYDKTLALIQEIQSENGELCLIGLWIQDWVGTHTFPEDGTRLLWNWELNTNQYPDWDGLFGNLSRANHQQIKRLTYINPYFANVTYLSPNGFESNYFEQGLEKHYFVMNRSGDPYLISSLSIDFATVDLTNPSAVLWIKHIIQHNMINVTKVSGFMADFGEYIPFDAVFYDTTVSASFYHNEFAQKWAQIVREAVHEMDDADVIIPFHRSSSLLSPTYARAFWYGDQFVTFDSRDGIQSVLYGMFSGSMMGHSISHSDIGGYTMLNIEQDGTVLFNYTRSEELLLRWLELSAFSDMIYRSHPGNIPNTSSQIYSSPAAMRHFVQFSNVFHDLSEYKWKLMNDSYAFGVPIVRHLFFNYPNDPNIRQVVQDVKGIDQDDSKENINDNYVVINHEFLLGDCLLMAPVLYPNVTAKTIYLPKGGWTSYWNKQMRYESNGQFYHNIDCPLGEPPVFVCDSWSQN
eukprot:184879_1